MPAGVYHIYNTGVDNREIFLEEQDYVTFINILKSYLSPNVSEQIAAVVDTRPFRQRQRQQMNLANEVKLYSYCLTATSFHLLLRLIEPKGIVQLMQRVCTTYVIYFNKKYHRIGTLFQGVYKTKQVVSSQEIVDASKHIHLLPIQVKRLGPFSTVSGSIADYPYSSYLAYKTPTSPTWIARDELQSLFSDSIYNSTYTNYARFVETGPSAHKV